MEAFGLGDAASDDDALRWGDGEEALDAVGEIPGLGIPGFVFGGEFAAGDAPALFYCGAGGHSFEAVSVEGAGAFELIAGFAGGDEVAELRVERAVEEAAVAEYAGTDAGADGDVGDVVEAFGGTDLCFGEAGGVDVGFKGDFRIGKCREEGFCDGEAAPVWFWGGEDVAPVFGFGVDLDGAEGGDAHGGWGAFFGKPFYGYFKGLFRGGGGVAVFFGECSVAFSYCDYCFGSSEFHGCYHAGEGKGSFGGGLGFWVVGKRGGWNSPERPVSGCPSYGFQIRP